MYYIYVLNISYILYYIYTMYYIYYVHKQREPFWAHKLDRFYTNDLSQRDICAAY